MKKEQRNALKKKDKRFAYRAGGICGQIRKYFLSTRQIDCAISYRQALTSMNIQQKILAASITLSLHPAFAVCIDNETDLQLSYEIHNKNTGCPSPSEKFHSGILQARETRCHGEEGEEWKIFRFDQIEVSYGSMRVCSKNIHGIINRLQVSHDDWSDTWWCLDKHQESED